MDGGFKMLNNEEVTLLDELEPYIRRKWLIIFSGVLFFIIAALYGFFLPKSYRSTTLILVEQQKVPEQYVTPTDATPIEQRLNTISQQIMSRTNLESIIRHFNLYAPKEPGIIQKLFSQAGLSTDTGPVKETIIEQMKMDIEVEILGRQRSSGDAFSISYIGKDPEVTRQVTDALAAMFIGENLKIREQYAEGTTDFILSEMKKAKADLETQEEALSDFKTKHMGSLPEQLNANLRTLDRLQLELQSIRDSMKSISDRKLLLEGQYAAGRIAPLPGINDVLAGLYAELATLRNEERSLVSVYKDTYPDVILTRNRIREVEARIGEERRKKGLKKDADENTGYSAVTGDLMLLDAQVESLIEREKDIQEQIQLYEKRVEETPSNEQKLADLTRDYNISFQNYQQLLEKKLSAGMAENLVKRQKGEKFRVIDPANLPEKPCKPNVKLIAGAGGAGGLGLGFFIVYMLELINPVFRKPEDFDGVFDLPVLVQIPQFEEEMASPLKGKLKVINARKV